jgi:hypothetical protein
LSRAFSLKFGILLVIGRSWEEIMKQILQHLIFKFIDRYSPLVRSIADRCDIALYHPWRPHGSNEVIFLDPLDKVKHQVPKSVYFNTASGKIIVGKNVVFGENVMLLTGMHMNAFDASSASVPHHHVPVKGREIVIGEGAYIGSGAIIIGPCEIGKYSVVGAGSIVVKSIPDKHMVVGVPNQRILPIEKNLIG